MLDSAFPDKNVLDSAFLIAQKVLDSAFILSKKCCILHFYKLKRVLDSLFLFAQKKCSILHLHNIKTVLDSAVFTCMYCKVLVSKVTVTENIKLK